MRSSEAVEETRGPRRGREGGGRGRGASGLRSGRNRTRARGSPCWGSRGTPGARAAEERRGECTLDGGKEEVRACGQRDPLRGPQGTGDGKTLLGTEVIGCDPRAPSLDCELGGDGGIAALIPVWTESTQERKDIGESGPSRLVCEAQSDEEDYALT
ncbi:hypothetical protein NDU88_008538 [Pleurodeles waltl]|uniref:Uncharacterized protein n=1 Tax=Pleurodeles waltl TaxID=8319 RepID=A0AAV7N7H3_PLEWA|nr:hypothetical protein NDU88_008538 [Pleurodeles waltl]